MYFTIKIQNNNFLLDKNEYLIQPIRIPMWISHDTLKMEMMLQENWENYKVKKLGFFLH